MSQGSQIDSSHELPAGVARQQRRQLLVSLGVGGAGALLSTTALASKERPAARQGSPFGVVPDQFSGSDTERVQAAYDYVLENGLTTVYLDRVYDLTGGSVYLSSDDWAPVVIFVGGGLTKRDDGFMFDRRTANLATDAPKFQGVRFRGSEDATAVISNGSRMIRQNFSQQCDFRHVAAIHSDSYTQSVRFLNTEMYESAGTFILAPRHYDLSCHENRFEANSHRLIEAVTDEPGQWALSVARFTNNCIEGYTRVAPIRLSSASSLLFQGNYCEHNNTTLEFIRTDGIQQVSGKIEVNSFYESRSEVDIDLGQLNCSNLEISHNTSNAAKGRHLTRQRGGGAAQVSSNFMYSGGNEGPF
ncbi:MAG: hypothetical protein JJU25_03030 [Halomonas sp.]|nr:hypothetical protein [Halomonas sp.]MCC5881597.1 hypothetical protein [Halomonas sp.]